LIQKHEFEILILFDNTTTMASITAPDIPPNACQYLLPHQNMSVMEFLKFRLPIVQSSTSFAKPEQYFLTEAPTTIDLQDIQHLPMPPHSVVKSLAKVIPGIQYQSIQCPHVSTTDGIQYPLWIVQYWVELISICRICQKWAKADKSLQKQSKPHHGIPASDTGLIQDVYNTLSCIPWGRKIRGFSASIRTEYLTAYATTEWLNDEHITHMLDLLRCDVIQEGLSLSVEVELIWFIPKLIEGYSNQEKYSLHRSYRWIHRQGQALGTGAYEQVVSIGNIGRNHWIALVVDFT
jgi:hypothetical protein